jgi:flagellin-like hook-associated protein FlgL
VKLNRASTAYQAALQSGAKIMQLSLLDYLR